MTIKRTYLSGIYGFPQYAILGEPRIIVLEVVQGWYDSEEVDRKIEEMERKGETPGEAEFYISGQPSFAKKEKQPDHPEAYSPFSSDRGDYYIPIQFLRQAKVGRDSN